MSDKKFLYFLQENDGRFRQIKNGIVTSLLTPWPLPEAPDGNQEISIGYERSALYFGTLPAFSLELGFVLSGARILRNDFYKSNIDRDLQLAIAQLTYEWTTMPPLKFKKYYSLIYKAPLDFSTFEDSKGEHRVNINLLQAGLYKIVTAKADTEFSIPIGGDAANVYMDGMFVRGVFKWILPAQTNLGGSGYVGAYQLSNDNPIPGLTIYDVQPEFFLGVPDINSTQYFASTTQDIAAVNVYALFNGLNPGGPAGPVSLDFYIFNTVSNTLRVSINAAPDDPYPPDSSLEFSQTLDLLEGDRLFFKFGSRYAESQLQITAQSKAAPSYVSGYTLYDLGRKLIEQITGSPDNFVSTMLSGLGTAGISEIVVTSGDGVRGIAGAAIKTTWKDYWRAVNAYKMAECQIGDTVRIEGRSAAFDRTSPVIDLGEVKNFKISPAIDLMGTSVRVGHKEQKVDDTNGKFDFNGYQVYDSPVNRLESKEIDLTTTWKAGPVEIEQTRANYEGKTTTDSENDNDVFILATKPDEASNTKESAGRFFNGSSPFFPGKAVINLPVSTPQYEPGQLIRITGTTSNDGDYLLSETHQIPFLGQFLVTEQSLVDETVAGFMTIQLLTGKFYTLDRDIDITQLTDPDVDEQTRDSYFNVPVSPKRLLLQHAPWLAGAFWNYGTESLIFSSYSRNKEMQAGGIVEKADMTIPALGSPMFLPFYFEFDTLAPANLTSILEINPYPSFRFTDAGRVFTGFMWRAGIAANTEEEQTYKLLAWPDTNPETLIYA